MCSTYKYTRLRCGEDGGTTKKHRKKTNKCVWTRACVCVCLLQENGGNIPDKWSQFSPVTCLSNQHEGFMDRGYTERLQWEYKTSGINLASLSTWSWNTAFKQHQHQLNNLTLRWRETRRPYRSDLKSGEMRPGDLLFFFFLYKTFNVQAHLLLQTPQTASV